MSIHVEDLLEEGALHLKVATGRKGLKNSVPSPRIQKPGLLLTGVLGPIHSERIQVFGEAEIGYLRSLGASARRKALSLLVKPKVPPAIVVTRAIEPPPFLISFGREYGIPVLKSEHTSSILIERLLKFLDEKLAPTKMMHGVLVDVLGVGILITGKSGIGKSECALDLINKGYKLIADDAVLVKRVYPSTLFGMVSNLIPYYLEVRGVGIVNIKDLFGITAIRETKQLDIVIELVSWDPKGVYERLGVTDRTTEILGIELPKLKIPVSPGRSVSSLVEVAARNQILKIMGYHHGEELFDTINQVLNKTRVLKKTLKSDIKAPRRAKDRAVRGKLKPNVKSRAKAKK